MIAAEGFPPRVVSGPLYRNRHDNFDVLLEVELRSRWDAWIEFFVQAVIIACDKSMALAAQLVALRDHPEPAHCRSSYRVGQPKTRRRAHRHARRHGQPGEAPPRRVLFALSKLGRLGDVDLEDILTLLSLPEASWEKFEQLALEANKYYVGPDLTPNLSHVRRKFNERRFS